MVSSIDLGLARENSQTPYRGKTPYLSKTSCPESAAIASKSPSVHASYCRKSTDDLAIKAAETKRTCLVTNVHQETSDNLTEVTSETPEAGTLERRSAAVVGEPLLVDPEITGNVEAFS